MIGCVGDADCVTLAIFPLRFGMNPRTANNMPTSLTFLSLSSIIFRIYQPAIVRRCGELSRKLSLYVVYLNLVCC